MTKRGKKWAWLTELWGRGQSYIRLLCLRLGVGFRGSGSQAIKLVGGNGGGQSLWLVFSVCRNTSVLTVSKLWRLGRRPEESSSGLKGPWEELDEVLTRDQIHESHTCFIYKGFIHHSVEVAFLVISVSIKVFLWQITAVFGDRFDFTVSLWKESILMTLTLR